MKAVHTALVAAAAAAFATTAVAQQTMQPRKALGKGEGQVDIVAWIGYIERGETDKNFD